MEFILILLSSLLFTVPLYLPDLFFLSWFALIPLVYLSLDYDYSHSFVIALFVGILNSIFSFYWLYEPLAAALNMPSSFILFLLFIYFLISALPLALWMLINKFLQPQNSFSPFIAAFSWSGLEFLRFEYLNINPFNYLAYTQSNFAALTQYAAFGGIFLISFLTVLISAYLVKIFLNPKFKKAVPLIIFLLLIVISPLLFNSNLNNSYQYQNAAVLVNNLTTAKGADHFEQLNRESEVLAELINKSSSQYIFTAEKSLSFDLLRNNYYRKNLYQKIGEREAGSYLQLGSAAAASENYNASIKNSLFLLDSEYRIVNRCSKEKSVLAAVNLPYKKEIFDFINNYFNIKSQNLVTDIQIVNLNSLNYLNLIGDEIFIPIIPERGEQLNKNFNLIINSAAEEEINSRVYNNLSWAAAVMRAAENKSSVLRTVSGGYSGYINPKSKIEARQIIKSDTADFNVALTNVQSYYQKDPRQIPYLILIFNIVIILIKLIIIFNKKLSSRD